MEFDFKAEKMKDSQIEESIKGIEAYLEGCLTNLKSVAYRDGFEHGYAEGYAKAQQELKEKDLKLVLAGDAVYFSSSSFCGAGTAKDPVFIKVPEWYLGEPIGKRDGCNRFFKFCHDNVLVDSVMIFLNGLLQAPIHDYYFKNGEIIFKEIPVSSDWITIRYSYFK